MGCGVVIPGYNIVMMETPVTQEMYQEVMGANPTISRKHAKKPVTNVLWLDAVKFCNELSVRTELQPEAVRGKLQPAYEIVEDNCTLIEGANGYRLPSKDEWLYAEKGKRNYNWLFPYDAAWHEDNSGGIVRLVSRKKPNGYGLYDMLGNVWEWVNDKALNPKAKEEQHQLLGGSCISTVEQLKLIMLKPENYKDARAGFRLVRAHVEGSQQ